jgi:hypothetical protein
VRACGNVSVAQAISKFFLPNRAWLLAAPLPVCLGFRRDGTSGSVLLAPCLVKGSALQVDCGTPREKNGFRLVRCGKLHRRQNRPCALRSYA